MSKESIDREVEKILQEFEYPKNFAMVAAYILGHFKGGNLKVLDISKSSSLASYFIIGSVNNPIQAKSSAEEILRLAKQHDQKILSYEGKNSSDWVLIDVGDVIVHIFLESMRDIYALDELYIDSPQVPIPEEYYFSTADESYQDESGGYV